MLLSISTTHTPATDLGYLLHKHPARVHQKQLNFGTATLFFAHASEQRATAVLVVDVDPVGLVRRENDAFALSQYVNDRPYAASSFLSVALGAVLGSALGGRCRDKPELAAAALPWEVHIAALPCGANGEALVHRLFEPLGFSVAVKPHPLQPGASQQSDLNWGNSRYADVYLRTQASLQSVLQQLYVLIPVLDAEKHYWIGDDEVDKLLRKTTGSTEESGKAVRNWLATHPERELISRRYLRNQRSLVQQALQRLQLQAPDAEPEFDEAPSAMAEAVEAVASPSREEKVEKPLGLNARRMETIAELIDQLQASTVLDLGCGDGKLLRKLLPNKRITRLVGVDVAMRELQRANARLKLDEMPERERIRIELLQGSLIYRDQRLQGFELATVIEVIEHLDPHRLQAFASVLFAQIAPKHILLSTPNVEFNVRFENLAEGLMRHPDHRFEWSRAEFQQWAGEQAQRYAYQVRFLGIGASDPQLGPPTQLAHFFKSDPSAEVRA